MANFGTFSGNPVAKWIVDGLPRVAVVIVTILGLVTPQFAFAGCPGCCSSHGGIANFCASNGRIYCNDGTVSPSCACASCGVASTPTCTAGSVNNAPVACGAGFSGTKFTTTTTTCPAGIYGVPSLTTSGYNTSACVASTPTCTAGSVNNAPVACSAGFSGTKFTTTTTTCPAGIYGAPSLTTSGYNTNACVATVQQNYSDSWWNINESGWGITITDHDTNAFVQWYTYDLTGHNQKYVISGGVNLRALEASHLRPDEAILR